jgi:hypothetical protein
MKAYAALPSLGFVLLFLPSSTSQVPSNDECINAVVIPSNVGITSKYTTIGVETQNATSNLADSITNCTFSNVDAGIRYVSDGRTLWYQWTPAVSGTYEFHTDGSTYNDNSTNDGEFTNNLKTSIALYSSCTATREIKCVAPFSFSFLGQYKSLTAPLMSGVYILYQSWGPRFSFSESSPTSRYAETDSPNGCTGNTIQFQL